jgi:two-component system LytT family response regulator
MTQDNQALRTIIVDDEPLALKLLEAKLSKIKNIEIIDRCKNGREAIDAILDKEPHLVFLDIQMPGISGLDVVKHIQDAILPMVVFATAYEEYALEAFDANAVDYILKPIDDDRIQRAITRARERFNAISLQQESLKQPILKAIQQIDESHHKTVVWPAQDETDKDVMNSGVERKLVIKDRDEIFLIKYEDVQWIDAAGDYICVHAGGQTYLKRSTLKEVLDELEDEVFQRVHRSTIVNLNAIEKVIPHTKGEFFLIMGEQHKVKVSRNYKDVIRDFLSNKRPGNAAE